jgi:hypothetical protein
MDALGINWQYLLYQCSILIFNFMFAVIVVFLLVRKFRPGILSHHLINLKSNSEGLIIPKEFIDKTNIYELRKFGKALMLISKE